MPVTIQDVERIARLAHLDFDSRELERFTGQFQKILEYVDQLDSVPTGEVEPTCHALEPPAQTTPLRADEVEPSLPVETVLENAPDSDQDHFRVPPVIE